MSHQIHWPDWWKLWPHHSASFDVEFGIYHNVRSFGPFQWDYWDDKGTFEERSYQRGRTHAFKQSMLLGKDVAFDLHNEHYTLDYNHPFDRGIIEYFRDNP